VVRQPGASADAYGQALLQAEEACRQQPWNGTYVNTLGVAQYRVGQYREALDSLKRADSLYSTQVKASVDSNLAFLAMTLHRLGNQAEAQAVLTRLRESMKSRQLASKIDAQALLREAEALIEGKAADPRR
jgi:hypothetical protein